MMKFMRKSKGYISIFLCLVMLPMVTFATMVIDVSRLQCARSTITSAGDLTMNAGLSEFEESLQELYGIFGTTTSDEELQTALESYFTKTITSTIGTTTIEEDQFIQNMADELTSAILGGQDFTQFDFTNLIEMQMEGGDDDFSYDGAGKSALANPAVMKQQIVDYMKYKGPLSLASTLLSKLKFFKDSANQTKAVEKKVEYTKTLSDLQDPCEAAYKAIIGNDERDYDLGSTWEDEGYNDCVEMYNQSVSDFKEHFDYMKTGHKKMCEYLYYYHQLQNRINALGGFDYNSMKYKEQCIRGTIELYDESTCSDLDSCLSAFGSLVVANDPNLHGTFESYFGEVKYDSNNNVTIDDSNVANGHATLTNMTGWIGTLTAPNGEMPSEQHQEIYTKYENKYELQLDFLDNIINGSADIAGFTRYYEQLQSLNDATQKAWDTYYQDYSNQGSDTDGITEEEMTEKKDTVTKIQNLYNKMTSDYLGKYKGLLSDIVKIDDFRNVAKGEAERSHAIGNIYRVLCLCYDRIGTVIEKLNDVLDSIDKVDEAKRNWNSAIGDVEDATMKTNFSNDYATATDGISRSDVQDLIGVATEWQGRIREVKGYFENVSVLGVKLFQNGGESYYYNTDFDALITSQFQTFSGYSSFKDDLSKADASVDNIKNVLVPNLIDEQAKYAGLDNGHPPFYESANPSGHINKLDGKSWSNISAEDVKEKFFYTLKSICNPKQAEKPTDNEGNEYDPTQQVEDATSAGDDAKEEAKTEDEGDGGTPESGGEEGGEKASASEVATAYSNIVAYSSNGGGSSISPAGEVENNMEIGNKDKYSDNADKAAGSLNGATNVLSQFTQIAENGVNKAYLEEYFTELFTCQTDKLEKNQSYQLLNGKTIQEINHNTDWYGLEMEYLIWGNEDLEKNLATNKTMIFTIRFAFNAVYAFTASDIQSFASTTATALVGWSGILVPVVQACITVALALAESGYDLKLLMDGESVPIIKNQTTFVCSPTNALKTLATTAIEEATKFAISKINEGIDNLVSKAEEGVEITADEVNTFIQDYTDEQTQAIKSTIKSYFTTPLVNKITPVINLLNESESNAVELTKNAVKEAFDEIERNLGSGGNPGFAESIATQVLEKARADSDTWINQIANKLKEDTPTADSITKFIDSKVDGCIDPFNTAINNKVEALTGDFKDKINECLNNSAGDLKKVINEEMDKLSSQLTNKVTNTITENLATSITDATTVTTKSTGLTLNYKEYCKIFMIVSLVCDENAVLKRGAALMQANVRAVGKNTEFDITKSNTLVSINARVKLGTLFPWAVSVTENNASAETEASLDLSHLGSNYVIIDYSGVSGY